MLRTFGASALLAIAMVMPAQQAAAQDPLLGGLLGGAAGAIIGGGVTGRSQGAAVGAIIGAAAGAIIASEGQRYGSYYAWRQSCYLQRADGAWVRVGARYCAPAVYVAPPPVVVPGDAVAYCAQRYRSYDPVSQTYLGYDGLRHPCP